MRVKLLVVTHNYPRFPGDPAGAFVARLARAAAASGLAVRVLAPHAPALAVEETDGAVTVERFHYAPERLEVVAYTGELHARPGRSLGFALLVPLFLAGFRRAVRRAVSADRPDVVHAHWWIPGGLVSGSQAAPVVVTCHGSDVRLLDRPWVRPLARWVLRRAAAVTTVSGFLARDLARLLPGIAAKVEVMPMPVDLEPWIAGRSVPKASPPRILYAGNLLPSKGVDILLRACRLLMDRRVAFQLRVLGEGPSRHELQALARALGLNQVEWCDFVGQDAMPAEYGASTVLVLPTRGNAEGLGLVLVEALMAGCAVIGTPAGGIPEVIEDRVTGRLVRDGDAEGLADALAGVLTDDSSRSQWITAGQARVAARFATENAVKPYLALYERLAGHHGRR